MCRFEGPKTTCSVCQARAVDAFVLRKLKVCSEVGAVQFVSRKTRVLLVVHRVPRPVVTSLRPVMPFGHTEGYLHIVGLQPWEKGLRCLRSVCHRQFGLLAVASE